jgi:formate C-acetyltransferase
MAIVTERITEKVRLRPEYQSKGARGKGRVLSGLKKESRVPYRPGTKLDIERARLITEGYKQAEGEPIITQRAKAMAYYLDNMTLYILPDERIVGNVTSEPNCVITYPELWWRWLDKAIDKDYAMLLDEEGRAELHEIHKYWQNKAVHGMERRLLPEDVLPYWFFNNTGVISWLHGGRTGVADYEKVFRIGANGLIKECEDRLKELASAPELHLHVQDYLEQRRFLEAAIIELKALVRFGQRFAQLARNMAEEEKDKRRKKELEEIAQICDWVPGNPARTLHEALQCYWFIFLTTRIIDLQAPGGGDRFDQIMYPLYKKDVEEGKLTRLEAQELVEHLWLKMNEEGQLVPPVQAASTPAIITARVLTIGGQTVDGDDATNEMSYIVMDAVSAIRLAQPAIAIRLHRNTPTEFLYAISKALHTFAGVYSFFNDEMMIPYLMSLGIPLEDARNYTTEGCMRWVIPCKAMSMRALGGYVSLPKCLEYALTQGRDYKFFLDKKIGYPTPDGGRQIGTPTPDPLTFTSIEDVIEAYLTQVRFFFQKLATIYNMVDVLDGEYLPQPLLSAMLDGCIEHGQDCRQYKYFPNTIFQPVGQITVVNSLVAMKKLIFDDKKVSMAQIVDALRNNWEGDGREELRQMFLNAPKFGNDDDYVDLVARDVYLRTTQTFRSFKNIWGGPFLEDGTGGATYYNYSGLTGATPDGRKDRDLFNDGTISPVTGTDKKGPTAVLKSVGKIDHERTFTNLLNQKFLPLYLSDEYKDAFAAYMRSFVNLGIHHIQFNVVDRQILEDAMEHPENYGDLVVRVAGFSAYFTDLDEEVQEQIIARTEQVLG